jgi:hypothetical protein
MKYYIQSGVRRAYAAWASGRSSIPAKLIVEGQPDAMIRVDLSDLYSPKLSFARDYRYITRVEYPIVVLGNDPDPIEVQPLGSKRQTGSVHISLVKVM